MKNLLSVLSIASAGFATLAFWTAPAAAGPGANWSSGDACFAIADSKVREWNQAKLVRNRIDTMADGKKRPSVMIFTENGMFEQVSGIWRTGQALRNQRVAGSTENVMKRMGLTDCVSAGGDNVDGQKATAYTYSQDPDIKAKIWISDASGLPLRVDLQQSPGRDNNPVSISMHYAYNDDVHVPDAAVLRNWVRMNASQDWLRYMASGSSSGTR
jgi:hypothetical protein